jgi:hypothetical protein
LTPFRFGSSIGVASVKGAMMEHGLGWQVRAEACVGLAYSGLAWTVVRALGASLLRPPWHALRRLSTGRPLAIRRVRGGACLG